MAFKQKSGSPFQRNFGIGNSPVKHTGKIVYDKEESPESPKSPKVPEKSYEGGPSKITKPEGKEQMDAFRAAQLEVDDEGSGLLQKSPVKQSEGYGKQDKSVTKKQGRYDHLISDKVRRQYQEAKKKPAEDRKFPGIDYPAMQKRGSEKYKKLSAEDYKKEVDRQMASKKAGKGWDSRKHYTSKGEQTEELKGKIAKEVKAEKTAVEKKSQENQKEAETKIKKDIKKGTAREITQKTGEKAVDYRKPEPKTKKRTKAGKLGVKIGNIFRKKGKKVNPNRKAVKMKSALKDTRKFGEITSPEEIREVGRHNQAHKDGVPADHSKGIVKKG